MDKKANSRSEFLFSSNLLNSKRSQAQIITVVLIILLVLAAIVVVWQVIRATVKGSAAEVAGGTQCITMDLSITKYEAGDTNITVKRGVGDGDLAKMRVIIDGIVQDFDAGTADQQDADASGLDELGSLVIGTPPNPLPVALAPGNKVEIAGIISLEGGGTKLCDIADEEEVL